MNGRINCDEKQPGRKKHLLVVILFKTSVCARARACTRAKSLWKLFPCTGSDSSKLSAVQLAFWENQPSVRASWCLFVPLEAFHPWWEASIKMDFFLFIFLLLEPMKKTTFFVLELKLLLVVNFARQTFLCWTLADVDAVPGNQYQNYRCRLSINSMLMSDPCDWLPMNEEAFFFYFQRV